MIQHVLWVNRKLSGWYPAGATDDGANDPWLLDHMAVWEARADTLEVMIREEAGSADEDSDAAERSERFMALM